MVRGCAGALVMMYAHADERISQGVPGPLPVSVVQEVFGVSQGLVAPLACVRTA